jgi:formylmethanofuran dehydrogenase subunit E
MSDRWGPSIDCKRCGETVSFGRLREGLCEGCYEDMLAKSYELTEKEKEVK